MPNEIAKLRDEEEMFELLLKINDEPNAAEKFYPMLTKHAGEEKNAIGLVVLIQVAIKSYGDTINSMMASILNTFMDEFIDALCPDEKVANDAKAIFAKAVKAARKA